MKAVIFLKFHILNGDSDSEMFLLCYAYSRYMYVWPSGN